MSLVGKTLNRYEMISLLGEGGMGAVYKGHDVTLERDVAIKIMHSQHARKTDFRERFLQEARASARMDHPGIVKVFDFGQADGILYIVMEFIAGENLRELLVGLRKENSWLSMNEALILVGQLAKALSYIHGQGVLHRDIKPANVMLKPAEGEELPFIPVLTDLGLDRLLEGEGMTETGTSMGTPMYMSPEQALGQRTDERSDVYSLGILLYELAVGQPPFPIRSLADAVNYHPNVEPPTPRSLRPDVPENLEKAILFALNKNPESRFPDASTFVRALDLVSSDVTSIEKSVPTVLEGQVSLMTQFQNSLVSARGASVLEEFPQAAEGPQDRIQVMTDDQPARDYPFSASELVLGRGGESDVVLNSTNVSRRHVRISAENSVFSVTDLNSTNGTFLGSNRLLPGVAETWTPDVALRLGEFWVRLLPAKGQDPTAIYQMEGSMFGQTAAKTHAGSSRIGILWDSPQIAVAPGAAQAATFVLLNQGGVVDHFEIAVEGIPADWIPNLPAPVQLMPGSRQQVSVTIRPPADSSSKAGRYPIVIRARSQDAPSEVTPAIAFSSQLHPSKLNAGDRTKISIKNSGNIRETFTVSLTDRAGELDFQPPRTQLTVEPGAAGSADVRVDAIQRPFIGRNQSRLYLIDVSDSQGGSQSHSGELTIRPRIPIWLIPVFIVLCLACIAASSWLYGFWDDSQSEATQTAQALSLTGTWEAMNVDTDGDGLTDIRELELGTTINDPDSDDDGVSDFDEISNDTDPMHWDSDEDGLSDGDEIVWGTDPAIVDTDGDGWPDGKEVHEEGTSPILTDTDEDGISDPNDPDPGSPPTPTSSPTPPPTVTDTPVATGTPPPTGTATATPTATATQTPVLAGGGFITYKVSNGGNVNIYLQNKHGSPIVLISGADDDDVLDYTPDKGGRFVIWALDGGSEDIYIVRQDGEIIAGPLNEGWAEVVDADWSLDANRLVVEVLVGGNPKYYFYQANGNLQGQGNFPP